MATMLKTGRDDSSGIPTRSRGLDVENALGVAVVELFSFGRRDGRGIHERYGGRGRLIGVVDRP